MKTLLVLSAISQHLVNLSGFHCLKDSQDADGATVQQYSTSVTDGNVSISV